MNGGLFLRVWGQLVDRKLDLNNVFSVFGSNE